MRCPNENRCGHRLQKDGSARLDARGCCRDCGTVVQPRPRPEFRPNNAGRIASMLYHYEGTYSE